MDGQGTFQREIAEEDGPVALDERGGGERRLRLGVEVAELDLAVCGGQYGSMPCRVWRSSSPILEYPAAYGGVLHLRRDYFTG